MFRGIARKMLFIVIVLATLASCTTVPAVTPQPTTPVIDVSDIVANAVEIREERYYFVALRMAKHEYGSPLENWSFNYAKSILKVIMVGQFTYHSWQEGQYLSVNFDEFKAVLGNEYASYTVRVDTKWTAYRLVWIDKEGAEHGISREKYDEALKQIPSDRLLTVPFTGQTVSYVLDKPIGEYIFVSSEPLKRHFVEVRVANETVLSLTKPYSNAYTQHLIQFEVPENVYEDLSVGEAWEPEFYLRNIILSGNLSQLHGYVYRRWQLDDPRFLVAVTDTGEEMIVPKEVMNP